MDNSGILERLEDLTQRARKRKARCDGMFAATVGGAEIDFMTPEELRERHALLLQLPTSGEEREAARFRIQARIAARKAKQSLRLMSENSSIESARFNAP